MLDIRTSWLRDYARQPSNLLVSVSTYMVVVLANDQASLELAEAKLNKRFAKESKSIRVVQKYHAEDVRRHISKSCSCIPCILGVCQRNLINTLVLPHDSEFNDLRRWARQENLIIINY